MQPPRIGVPRWYFTPLIFNLLDLLKPPVIFAQLNPLLQAAGSAARSLVFIPLNPQLHGHTGKQRTSRKSGDRTKAANQPTNRPTGLELTVAGDEFLIPIVRWSNCTCSTQWTSRAHSSQNWMRYRARVMN